MLVKSPAAPRRPTGRPSADLTNAIIHFLYTRGSYAWRASSQGTYDSKTARYRTAAKKGVSDILAIIPPHGRTLAIEVKIGADRLRPEQEGFLATIVHHGGLATVAKALPDFIAWYDANVASAARAVELSSQSRRAA